MKLPKFIKNSTEQRHERQQNLQRCNRQLLLTDQLQPHKFVNKLAGNKLTPGNNSTTVAAAVAAKVASIQSTTPLLNDDLYQIKHGIISATSGGGIMSESFNFKKSNAVAAMVVNSSASRYVKSAQPKRLQRTRIHVTSKPANYVARSTLAVLNVNNVNNNPTVNNIAANNILTTNSSNSFGSIYFTPLASYSTENKVYNGRKLDTNKLDEKENVDETTATKKDTTSISGSNSKTANLPETPNRFSFSKLTRFVSKSALKVMNRKQSNGSLSNDSNLSSDSSLNSSGLSSSSPATPTTGTDDDEEKQERQAKKCATNKPEQPPVYCEIEPPSPPKCLIYQSIEQRKEMEEKIAKQATTSMMMSSTMMSNRLNLSKQPSMGVTSVMLQQMRKNTSGYGITTGLFTTSVCLIAAPVVFQTSQQVNRARQNERPVLSIPQLEQQEEQPTYDKLARAPFLGEEAKTPKRLSKPIVKSLSSIVAAYSTPCKAQSFNKIAPISPVIGVSAASSQNKNCRISIFSAKKLNNYNSTGRLDQQLNYESFSEAIF